MMMPRVVDAFRSLARAKRSFLVCDVEAMGGPWPPGVAVAEGVAEGVADAVVADEWRC